MDGENSEGVKCTREAESRVSFQIASATTTKCGQEFYSQGQNRTTDLSGGPTTLEPSLVLAWDFWQVLLIKIQILTMLTCPSGIYMYLCFCLSLGLSLFFLVLIV